MQTLIGVHEQQPARKRFGEGPVTGVCSKATTGGKLFRDKPQTGKEQTNPESSTAAEHYQSSKCHGSHPTMQLYRVLINLLNLTALAADQQMKKRKGKGRM